MVFRFFFLCRRVVFLSAFFPSYKSTYTMMRLSVSHISRFDSTTFLTNIILSNFRRKLKCIHSQNRSIRIPIGYFNKTELNATRQAVRSCILMRFYLGFNIFVLLSEFYLTLCRWLHYSIVKSTNIGLSMYHAVCLC